MAETKSPDLAFVLTFFYILNHPLVKSLGSISRAFYKTVINTGLWGSPDWIVFSYLLSKPVLVMIKNELSVRDDVCIVRDAIVLHP